MRMDHGIANPASCRGKVLAREGCQTKAGWTSPRKENSKAARLQRGRKPKAGNPDHDWQVNICQFKADACIFPERARATAGRENVRFGRSCFPGTLRVACGWLWLCNPKFIQSWPRVVYLSKFPQESVFPPHFRHAAKSWGLNGHSPVAQADIACSNGWVHVVSRVAVAPAYNFPAPMKNILQLLCCNDLGVLGFAAQDWGSKRKTKVFALFYFFAYTFGSVAFFAFDGTVPQFLLCVWGLRSPRHTFQTLQLVPYWVAWTRTSQMSVVNLCRGCEQREEFQRQRYLADSTNIMCEHICTFSLASCSSDGASIFLLHVFFMNSLLPIVWSF